MYVTNRTEKELVIDYNCAELRFPVGKPVEMSEYGVRHVFGYGLEDKDKEQHMASLGIIQTRNDIPKGLEILAKFEITEQLPTKNQSLSPLVEQVPLPPKKGGGKILAMNA